LSTSSTHHLPLHDALPISPHHIDSGISKSNGVVFAGIGKYTTSNEIKKVMIGFLRSIKATFEVLEKHLAIKKIIKPKYTFLYCLNRKSTRLNSSHVSTSYA